MFDTVSKSGAAREPRARAAPSPSAIGRHVVILLDPSGQPRGAADKRTVHDSETPLHLAFSCHVVGGDGRVLLTRRSMQKRTWPGVWSNACCGHPRPDETLRAAVTRHLRDELGLVPHRMSLALGDFAYRATMGDGTVEHELCPVVVVGVSGAERPDPAEVDATAWVPWGELVRRAADHPETLSPWSVAQIGRLARAGIEPRRMLDRCDSADGLLDRVHGDRRRPVASPLAVERTRRRVDDHLAAFLEARSGDVPEALDAIAALHDAVQQLTRAGGKRLRPVFVMWGHVAAGGSEHATCTLDAGGAVELLHTFALIHDDVMDRSALRRNQPTAQHRLRLGRRHELAVDDEWFGISAAVLAGDLAFVWADQMFDRAVECDLAPARGVAARALFTQLRTEVIAGQYLDLRVGCSPAADEGDAARIALLKTARYTVTRPLQIGAALAGADEEVHRRLAAYGDAAGVAFQLRDDVLGLFGDPRRTGKSCADDLREGKRTLLMLRARELATPSGRAVLDGSLGRSDLDDAAAQRCRDVVAGSGALASIEAAIDVHLERAAAAAQTFGDDAATALLHLADQAARRDH